MWYDGITNSTTIANSTTSGNQTMPAGFCNTGFHSVYLAFVFSLMIDLALQLYLYFVCQSMIAHVC